jgi:hypothetical protein
MPLSFQQHTANGSTTVFDASQIDGYLSVSDIYVYVNDVQKTVGVHYSLQTSPSLQITFLPGNTPALKDEVRIQRITPNTVSGRSVDFADGSVLNANDLDKSALQLLYITQEAEDTGSGALGKQFDQLSWNAEGLPITSAATGGGSDSLTTKGYVDTLALYGGGAVNPQAWTFSGDNVLDTFTLSPVANATNPAMFIVEVGGTILRPTTDYTIPTDSQIVFATAPALGTNNIIVRNFGVSRNLNESVSTAMIQNNAVTTAKILNDNVTAAKLAANSVETAKITDLNVTTGKLADLAVTTSKIADLNVTTGKIADLGVATGKIAELGVTTGKIANGAVTSAKLDTNIAISGQLTVGSVGQSLVNKQFSDSPVSGASVIAAFPTWARRVTVSFAAVSSSGTSYWSLHVRRGGTRETAGYKSRVLHHGVAWDNTTAAFLLTRGITAANFYTGMYVLDRVDTAGTIWCLSGQMMDDGANTLFSANGYYAGGTTPITGIEVLPSVPPQVWDGGRIAISWE